MAVVAAGMWRRSEAERVDQRLSWVRTDRAFFAAGACHLLAWTCRATYPDEMIGIASLVLAGENLAYHTYAIWGGWAFDHCGWNQESDLVAANEQYEGKSSQRIQVTTDLGQFCQDHHHRMPHEYWDDPRPRARAYVSRYPPPWSSSRVQR